MGKAICSMIGAGLALMLVVGCGQEQKPAVEKKPAPVSPPIAVQPPAPEVAPEPIIVHEPLTEFAQEITVVSPIRQMRAGSPVTMPVVVKNTSSQTWPMGDEEESRSVRLAYQWLDTEGNIIIRDGIRTYLEKEMAPGSSAQLNAMIQAPDKPGEYILRLTMIQEGVAWFHRQGAKPFIYRVTVTAQ